jgi:hypothetical protein
MELKYLHQNIKKYRKVAGYTFATALTVSLDDLTGRINSFNNAKNMIIDDIVDQIVKLKEL